MTIQLLPDQLASQIAAGEVVERPVSVVKELVENGLDAEARVINIDVRGGGRQMIQVADDGLGIPAGELSLAFVRHATSKIKNADDLKGIATLGFRGEALAAIAAVSQVTVVTRTAGDPAGTRLRLDGGHVTGRESVGAPLGSVIAVENLFYNMPARLKFLKSVTTERRLIDEFVTCYALAYPHVRFRLTHDGRITFQSGGQGNLRDVLVSAYGPEVAGELLPIEPAETGPTDLLVTGYAGPPSLHRPNRSQIILFVNGRWIRDQRLTYAIFQAYHTLLPSGRYPMAVVFVQMPYEQVDVNVHPAKTEVRFRDASAVFGAVQRAVRETIVTGSPIRPIGLGMSRPEPIPNWNSRLDRPAFTRPEPSDQSPPAPDWPTRKASEPPPASPIQPTLPHPAGAGDRLPIMRVVGQVGAAYIITEGPDGIYLIDQHAAHERILYEQFMAQWQQNSIAVQGLITAATVHLSPSQATLLADNLEGMVGLGFQIEPFGPNSFLIRALPGIVARRDPAQTLLDVVDELEREAAPLQGKIEAKIITRVCKTAAIKAGQTLAAAEMEAMIQQLENCHSPLTCPHGRPTLIHLSAGQLARQFGRT